MRLLIFFAVLLSVRTESNEKRIILHSATDIAQELLSLKSEFESVKAKLSNMTLEISSLKAENIGLRSQLAGLTKPKTGKFIMFILRETDTLSRKVFL